MTSKSHLFNVGDIECVAISDGTFVYKPPMFPPPTNFLFANAPKEQLERVLREHHLQLGQWTEWMSPYICLLVKTHRNRVLIDTGAGSLSPDTGKLLQNLRAEGITPRDIDTVILTHAHPDHTGGNTTSEGKPAFPSARFVMWKDEWDFWTSEEAKLKADEHLKPLFTFADRNLPPIRDRLDLLDSETEIVPGVRAVQASGHTPGHMALTISSGGEQLLLTADAVLHPIHVEEPDWYSIVDYDPPQAVATRRRLLNQAIEERALVLAFHFPFPGLGYIIKKGERRRWQPI